MGCVEREALLLGPLDPFALANTAFSELDLSSRFIGWCGIVIPIWKDVALEWLGVVLSGDEVN